MTDFNNWKRRISTTGSARQAVRIAEEFQRPLHSLRAHFKSKYRSKQEQTIKVDDSRD
jgi:hypothetical protein